jgi:predicted outer membrane repeat protein
VENTASEHGGGLYCHQSATYILRSILAFQAGEAIACDEVSQPYLECSDLYGNSGGDWIGPLAEQLGVRGNICDDPLFCEEEGPIGSSLALQEDSPCGPENNECGLMGAWQVGCESIDVALEDFTVSSDGQNVRAIWRLATPQPDATFRLEAERRGSQPAIWEVPYDQFGDRLYVALDDSDEVHAGGKIIYSLYARLYQGPWQLLATAHICLEIPAWDVVIDGASPNPFNPCTTIRFTLGSPSRARVAVYDMTGKLVIVLAEGHFRAGQHTIDWTARDLHGAPASSGTYLLVLETDQATVTQKLLLLK